MADRDDGPTARGESLHDRTDPLDAARVLARRRLVENDNRRPHREDGRESEQLAS